MNFIYHEKQEGSLCAQHCLNNLLQGQYFSAVDLAELANKIDFEERQRMAEVGTNTEDYKKFIEQPSSNMDDSGMFSVQVLSTALIIWGMNLIPLASSNPLAKSAREQPVEQNAFICNFKEHWLTVRKLGQQWFNLNSLLTYPELISDTYLSLFLTQLRHEGYSIFVLEGALPPSKADDALKLSPAKQSIKPQLLSEVADSKKSKEDLELRAALSASLAKYGSSSDPSDTSGPYGTDDPSDQDLKRALQMSLDQPSSSKAKQFHGSEENDDLQQAISLSLQASSGAGSSCSTSGIVKNESGGDLEKALQMSLDSVLCDAAVPENPLEPEIEMVRRKRLEKLMKK